MRSCSLLILLLLLPRAVEGQTTSAQDAPQARPPVGPFVVDVRAAFPKLTQDETIASGIGVTPANLPTRGLGLVFGAHVYPVHRRSVALGLGGEILLARRGRALDPATEGGTPGPTVNTRFSAISPQVSLNFGGRDGWSYLSGGIGWGSFSAERADQPQTGPASRARAINYGAGARWFSKKHLALSLDLRFYVVNATEASGTYPARPRIRSMALGGGVAFR